MIMSNSTGSNVDVSDQEGSSLGLALGLTFFFLAVLVVVGALAYRFREMVGDMLRMGRGQSRSKEESAEPPPPPVAQHHYTSLSREAAAGQNPIYENLSTAGKGSYRGPEDDQRGLPSEHEEDLYLQCDLPDDAIYSNDPACSLTIHSDFQDEDVYIVPES